MKCSVLRTKYIQTARREEHMQPIPTPVVPLEQPCSSKESGERGVRGSPPGGGAEEGGSIHGRRIMAGCMDKGGKPASRFEPPTLRPGCLRGGEHVHVRRALLAGVQVNRIQHFVPTLVVFF